LIIGEFAKSDKNEVKGGFYILVLKLKIGLEKLTVKNRFK
jgi:hypothetical protein